MQILNEDEFNEPIIRRVVLNGVKLTDAARADYLRYTLYLTHRTSDGTSALSARILILFAQAPTWSEIVFKRRLPLNAIPKVAVSVKLLLQEEFNRDRILTLCAARAATLEVETSERGIRFTLALSDHRTSVTVPDAHLADFFVP